MSKVSSKTVRNKKTPQKKKSGNSIAKKTTKPASTKQHKQDVSTRNKPQRPQSERVSVDTAGRIIVPAKFRKALGLQPGDSVTVTMEGNVLRVKSVQAAIEEAQALMRKHNPKKRSVVDELIAERRAEAAKE